MKIALVSPYDFAFPGGVVNHISCLEHYLTEMGHDVKIIAPASRAVHTFGDRFIRIGTPRPVPASGSIARITVSLWLSSRIKEVFARDQFDICHLHEPLMPQLCTTVLRQSEIPKVGTFHASGSSPWYGYGTPLGRILLRKWMRRLDGRIAVSPAAKSYIERYFPGGEYTIIPNGIDSKHFHPEVPPFEGYQDGFTNIVFVGRMEKRKGVNYLIEAFQKVKKEVPKTRLILVGPGTRLRRKYEKRISRNGLHDVSFVGYSSYHDLPRYYSSADIICAPATGLESFGIVLLEAMAVSKPLIASEITGYAGVLTHDGEGLLVPPRNADQLAEALLYLIKNKSLRQQMGSRGREKAIQYDWENISRRIVDFYMKVLNKDTNEEVTPEADALPV